MCVTVVNFVLCVCVQSGGVPPVLGIFVFLILAVGIIGVRVCVCVCCVCVCLCVLSS